EVMRSLSAMALSVMAGAVALPAATSEYVRIYEVRGLLPAQRRKEALDGKMRHLRTRLQRSAAQVRREHEARRTQQRVAGQERLRRHHVQPRSGNRPRLERGDQRCL